MYFPFQVLTALSEHAGERVAHGTRRDLPRRGLSGVDLTAVSLWWITVGVGALFAIGD